MITTAKERPIIFNGEMVRAILEGRKMQTRRPIKPQPYLRKEGFFKRPFDAGFYDGNDVYYKNPFGTPGDRLWVRETWCPEMAIFGGDTGRFFYNEQENGKLPLGHKWRPSIHMPRWASRITLEITDVRVERVQGITESDAIAEGFKHCCAGISNDCGCQGTAAWADFGQTWEQLYPGSWDRNDWIWAISFKRLQP